MSKGQKYTAYGRCVSYSDSPLLVEGYRVKGWNGVETALARGCGCLPVSKNTKSLLELPFRAGFAPFLVELWRD